MRVQTVELMFLVGEEKGLATRAAGFVCFSGFPIHLSRLAPSGPTRPALPRDTCITASIDCYTTVRAPSQHTDDLSPLE
jgi:hypothetical protein